MHSPGETELAASTSYFNRSDPRIHTATRLPLAELCGWIRVTRATGKGHSGCWPGSPGVSIPLGPQPPNGFTTSTPVLRKSRTLRVTTASPCVNGVWCRRNQTVHHGHRVRHTELRPTVHHRLVGIKYAIRAERQKPAQPRVQVAGRRLQLAGQGPVNSLVPDLSPWPAPRG